MKNFKKLMALIIAAAMIIGTMTTMAFAEQGALNVNGELKVTGLDEGDKVTYYQVISWNENETPDTTQGWIWSSEVDATVLTSADLAIVTGDKDGSGKIDSAMSSKIAANVDTSKAQDGGEVGADGKWSTTVTKPGLYMVIVEPATPGTMYNPIFVAANWYGNGEVPDSSNAIAVSADELTYSDEAMAKKSTIPLSKSSKGDTEDQNVTNPEGVAISNTSYTADNGEAMEFTVTTTVPKFGANYTSPVFALHDTLEGLALADPVSIVVTAQDGSALPANSYKVDKTKKADGGAPAAGDTEFWVVFSPDYLKGADIPANGQPVKVVYKAVVTDEAKKILNQEKNTIDLLFSTTPDDEEGKGLLRDQTNHFTFSIDADLLGHTDVEGSSTEAIKVGVDSSGNYVVETSTYEWSGEEHGPLEGAEFKLYTDAACRTPYKNDLYPNGVTVKSDASGRINIKGLDAATYYLKETTAPKGYIKMQDIVKITISAVINEDIKVQEEVNNNGEAVTVKYITNSLESYSVEFDVDGKKTTTSYTINLSASSALAVSADRAVVSSDTELKNTKGVELPSTGGIGTTIFYVIGAILVVGAGILLVTKRRMSTN